VLQNLEGNHPQLQMLLKVIVFVVAVYYDFLAYWALKWVFLQEFITEYHQPSLPTLTDRGTMNAPMHH
jgi:hypothetical protein